jgi:hypothetical protein
MGRAANAVYAVLVDEAHERGLTRAALDELLASEWGEQSAPPVPADDDEDALREFMGGITMEQLLGAEG